MSQKGYEWQFIVKKKRTENLEVGVDKGFFWQDGRHKFLEYTGTRTFLMKKELGLIFWQG